MSPHPANRRNGVCLGSLWKQHSSVAIPPKLAEFVEGNLDVNDRGKSHDYCKLVGNTLSSYPDNYAYQRGDFPTSEVRIVGASSWNPLSSTPEAPGSSSSPTFRIVTYAGTHIYCSAPSLPDRDIWLAALHSGLEASYALFHDTLRDSSSDEDHQKFSRSLTSDNHLILAPPEPHSYPSRFRRRRSADAQTINAPLSTKYCVSCGKYPAETEMRYVSAPLPQYGMESRADLCRNCLTAQGVLSHVTMLCGLYASHAHERAALQAARDATIQTIQNAIKSQSQTRSAYNIQFGNDLSESWTAVSDTSTYVHVSPADAGTKALLSLVKTPGFLTYRRRSRVLELECRKLERGEMEGAVEFLEILTERVNVASGMGNPDQSIQIEGVGLFGREDNHFGLKKEAFKVAGDMSAAIKMLNDRALPTKQNDGNTEMLACVLEFLLDLCEEGDLGSVAFFWPQLRLIHLRMLPPEDADALVRVELVEDFLLTVSARYSVHLALELVWGLIADLEESTDESTTNIACKARRYVVLRFACELESILFDFEGGWGGGSVSLRGMLNPSPHQASLIRDAMAVLQLHRRFSGYYLTRSVRLEKLKRDASKQRRAHDKEDSGDLSEGAELSAADYFSAQLAFVTRLSDIAEKLRFMEVEKREKALQKELDTLNANKKMGGDPLSRAGEGMAWVVRSPSKEGHVFRSKERTPVLLLLEVIRQVVEGETEVDTAHRNKIEGLMKDLTSESEIHRDKIDGLMKDLTSDENQEKIKHLVEELTGSEKKQEKIHSLMQELTEETQCSGKTDENSTEETNGQLLLEEFVPQSPNHVEEEGDVDTAPTAANLSLSDLGGGLSCSDKLVRRSPKPVRKLKQFGSDPSSLEPSTLNTTTEEEMEDLVANAVREKLSIKLPDLEEVSLSDDYLSKVPETSTEETVESATTPNEEPKQKPQILKSINKQPPLPPSRGRISAFANDGSEHCGPQFALYGDGRREVLTTILARAMRGNVIAKRASAAAQRAVQVMDRQRAVKLITNGVAEEDQVETEGELRSVKSSEEIVSRSEEDEAIESLRILLLQNRVAQGKLSPENAAKVLAPVSSFGNKYDQNMNLSSEIRVSPETNLDGSVLRVSLQGNDALDGLVADAGEVDARLTGCGPLTPAISNALKLWQSGVINNGELLELVQKDLQYFRQTVLPDANKLIEDSAFWVRFAFGERWAEKKARISATSPHGTKPGWDLVGLIVKSNDDLRQEAFVMQLIELCQEAFEIAGLELWVQPYRILATGRTTGIIETVRNALSFDSLKKRPGYGKGGLKGHFERMTEFDADPHEAFKRAQRNFVRSFAAYSLMSYFFMFKDRHNGNLLLDTAGHVIHIDFGFVFGIAPGGSFSLEMSTPFKLTEEMLEVMGGLGSPLFSEFVTLFCCGFLALQSHVDTFCTLVEITCKGSTFKCFDAKDPSEIIDKLRARFRPNLDKASTVVYALDLIKQATTSYGTKQYDFFQYLSQGIAT